MGSPTGAARTLADVAGLLRRHLPADDPLAGYADHLAAPGLGPATLVGYLSGSIDAVLRVPATAGNPARFLVVDYKTNLLRDPAEPGVERLAWGYRPEVLGAAMIAAHYPLQALLYSAALHRYLRWRLPNYDPDPAPRRGAVPVPARHGRTRHPHPGRHPVRGVRLASARRPGRSPCPTCSTGDAREHSDPPGHRATGPVPPRRDPRGVRRAGRHRPDADRRPPAGSATPADAHVALGAALCVRALRAGSVCVDLTADPGVWVPEGAFDDTTGPDGSPADDGPTNRRPRCRGPIPTPG